MTDGTLARLFWRAIDPLDYWIIEVKFWIVEALCGPEPEAEADRRWQCNRRSGFN